MIKRLIVENFWWKLFSLALSVGLWLTLVGESERGASVPAEVQFKNLPPNLEISSDPIDRIYLKVRGPASRLTDPFLSQAAVVLDLAAVNGPGEQTFTLDSSDVTLPQGVKVERVIPSQIRLRFERGITREVPVTVRFSGAPPKGYSIVAINTAPSDLQITGPESHVNHIKEAETDPIDVTSTVADASFRVSAFIPDQHVRVLGSPIVQVRVKLEKAPGLVAQP
jgi:hypothetical protein